MVTHPGWSKFGPRAPGLLLVLCASLIGGPTALHAEDDGKAVPTAAPTALTEKGEKLEIEFKEWLARLEEIRAQMQTLVGDDRAALEHRLTEERVTALEKLHGLADHLIKKEEADIDSAALRRFVTSWIEDSNSAFQREYALANERYLATAKKLEVADPNDVSELEETLDGEDAWIGILISAFWRNIQKSEALGLPTQSHKSFFREIVGSRANRFAGRIQLYSAQVAELETRAANQPADAPINIELQAIRNKQQRDTERLAEIAKLMTSAGMDATEFSQIVIGATGKLGFEIFDPKVAMGLLQSALGNARKKWETQGPAFLLNLVLFTLILILARGFAVIVRSMTRRAVQSGKFQVSQLLQSMLVSISSGVVMILGLLIALSMVGIQLGPVLAGLGIAGFIVGFALQDTLGNFASGAMILLYRPYDVGDLIEAGGAFGTVSNMTLVSTTILTIDNQTLVVPNSKIWGDVIKNVTAQKMRRVDLKFRVSYRDDVEHVERLLNAIVKEHAMTFEEPAPIIRLHELGDSSIEFVVRPWAKSSDYWDVYWDITREVKLRFDREGITIPLPQHDVRLHSNGAEETPDSP